MSLAATAQHPPPAAALHTFLRPLAGLMDDPDVTELSINQPGECFIERKGVIAKLPLPALTLAHLQRLATLIAYETHQVVDAQRPLLSAWLPTGQRVQVVLPPACENDRVVMSFRRPSDRQFSLETLEANGMFAYTEITAPTLLTHDDERLRTLFKAHRIREFLEHAVRCRRTIAVSGATASGKTTLLNALLQAVPEHERLITIEDVRELKPVQANCVHLLASRGGQGVAQVDMQSLLEASLRLRPDRIILGELRGAEAASFLHAINSGHPGSLTSVHADSPAQAYERLALMVMQGHSALTHDQILKLLRASIDVVVQVAQRDGQRRVVEIAYRHAL